MDALKEFNATGIEVESMRSLMDGLVLSLVDAKESVTVEVMPSVRAVAFVITVAAEDFRRLGGQHGGILNALRTIIGAAGKKFGMNCSVDLQEEIR